MRDPSYCSTTRNPTECGPGTSRLVNRASRVNCAERTDGSNSVALNATARDNNFIYGRLVTAGKPKMVALVACMHKLLTILNAIVRHRTPWTAPTGA